MRSTHHLLLRNLTAISAVAALAGCLVEAPLRPGGTSSTGAEAAELRDPDQVLRTLTPWQQLPAADRARQPGLVKADPAAFAETTVTAPNETDRVGGLIVEWWCSGQTQGDEWDELWMGLIGEAVRRGARAHVYLQARDTRTPAATLREACGNMLTARQNIDLGQVDFIEGVPTEAFWVRDSGPIFAQENANQNLTISDPRYYPSRPKDDREPIDWAQRSGGTATEIPLQFEGGNFLANGGGLCVVSGVIEAANPQQDRAQIAALFRSHLGCSELAIVQPLEDFATGHVDMWMAWVNQNTLIVGEYTAEQDATNRDIIERNVSEVLSKLTDPATGQPVRIVRMPMPSNCPAAEGQTAPDSCPDASGEQRIWRSYLNAVPLNGGILVPVYQQHGAVERQALGVWESLGFTPATLRADFLIDQAGVLHCVTKTIPAP
jgi:agmatine/peptidylarginine deiminase